MKLHACILGILVMVFCSCGLLLPVNPVLVVFPEVPSTWPAQLSECTWVVRHPGSGGQLVSERLSGAERSIRINLPRGVNIPVTARLFWENDVGYQSRPSGGVFPLQSHGFNSLQLQWSEGFSADTLMKILFDWQLYDRFNVARFCDVVQEKSEGHVWSIDQERILDRLSTATFSVYAVRPKASHQLAFTLTKGVWISDDPTAPAMEIAHDGEYEIQIFEGVSSYAHVSINQKDFDEMIVIGADTDGYTAVYSTTGEISVGRW